MEFLVEWAFGALIVVVGPLLTLLYLPGNTIMLAAGIGYAFFDEARYFDGRLLSALVLVYAFGEIWEFIVSFFGIRRHKVSWGAVFLIAVGTFIGAVIGTGFFPVLGSVLGGAVGSYIVAFGYEFMRTRNKENAFALAWKAAQTQFVAMLGKIVASFAMALLLFKQIFLNN